MAARRKKPRLYSFSRDVEIASFAEVVHDPEERALLVDIVDAFVEICRTHTLREGALAPFARGARHPSPSLRGMAITRLTVLSHYFPEAVTLLEEIATDEDEGVRLFVCAAIPNACDAASIPIVGRALTDPSWRVRKAAAQASGTAVHPEMISVLADRLAAETDARVRIQLQLALDFQRTAAPP